MAEYIFNLGDTVTIREDVNLDSISIHDRTYHRNILGKSGKIVDISPDSESITTDTSLYGIPIYEISLPNVRTFWYPETFLKIGVYWSKDKREIPPDRMKGFRYAVGEKVRLKLNVDLKKIGIDNRYDYYKGKTGKISEAYLGTWSVELDKVPTYRINFGETWAYPETYLEPERTDLICPKHPMK
jgi:ribosomal protein L21E